MKKERVLVCGDRNWTDREKIFGVLRHLVRTSPGVEVVIHGDCRGADRLAGKAAGVLAIPVEEYPAKWHLYGKRAGPIRNQQMLDEAQPTMVLAFHDDLENSKGTRDMVKRALKSAVPVWGFTHYNDEVRLDPADFHHKET